MLHYMKIKQKHLNTQFMLLRILSMEFSHVALGNKVIAV